MGSWVSQLTNPQSCVRSLSDSDRPRFRAASLLQDQRHGVARGAELRQGRGQRLQHFLPRHPRGRALILVPGHHGDEVQPVLLPDRRAECYRQHLPGG